MAALFSLIEANQMATPPRAQEPAQARRELVPNPDRRRSSALGGVR